MSSDQFEGLSVVLSNLQAWATGTHESAASAAHEIADYLEEYARGNHPWQVQTGQTNLTTQGTVVEGAEVIEIYLSAGMDYDVFLELARGGKWAWLWPALSENRDYILQTLIKHLGNGKVS